jgi:hypothetical protein
MKVRGEIGGVVLIGIFGENSEIRIWVVWVVDGGGEEWDCDAGEGGKDCHFELRWWDERKIGVG